MIIRPFQITDIPQCAAIHKLSRRASEEGIIFDYDLDRYDLNHFIEKWTDWAKHEVTQIRVAEENNIIIGFVIYGKIQTRPSFDKSVVPRYGAEIYALYVHPDHFRKGIGKALFKAAIDDLIERKLTSMLLWAYKKNKRACAFYELFGGERVAKQRVDIGEKSWAEESCFGWKDIRKIKI
jgi:ribosomal protein S18 acetylase RimI-like enzyme